MSNNYEKEGVTIEFKKNVCGIPEGVAVRYVSRRIKNLAIKDCYEHEGKQYPIVALYILCPKLEWFEIPKYCKYLEFVESVKENCKIIANEENDRFFVDDCCLYWAANNGNELLHIGKYAGVLDIREGTLAINTTAYKHKYGIYSLDVVFNREMLWVNTDFFNIFSVSLEKCKAIKECEGLVYNSETKKVLKYNSGYKIIVPYGIESIEYNNFPRRHGGTIYIPETVKEFSIDVICQDICVYSKVYIDMTKSYFLSLFGREAKKVKKIIENNKGIIFNEFPEVLWNGSVDKKLIKNQEEFSIYDDAKWEYFDHPEIYPIKKKEEVDYRINYMLPINVSAKTLFDSYVDSIQYDDINDVIYQPFAEVDCKIGYRGITCMLGKRDSSEWLKKNEVGLIWTL